jgi:hypothetical protein
LATLLFQVDWIGIIPGARNARQTPGKKAPLLLYKIAPCVRVLEAGQTHLVIRFTPSIGPIGEDALALHTELVVLAQPEDQIFIVFIWQGCKTQ